MIEYAGILQALAYTPDVASGQGETLCFHGVELLGFVVPVWLVLNSVECSSLAAIQVQVFTSL